MANREDLHWIIMFHLNNDAAKKRKGVEAYTYQGRQCPDAVEVCQLIAALGFKDSGVKAGSDLYVIRKTKSILFEICFVNEPDASTYQRQFDEICKAIVYGLSDYVGVVTKPEPPSALPEKKQYVRVKCDNLSIRSKPSWADDAVCGTVRKNEVFTIYEGPITFGNGRIYKLKSWVYLTATEKYVETYEK